MHGQPGQQRRVYISTVVVNMMQIGDKTAEACSGNKDLADTKLHVKLHKPLNQADGNSKHGCNIGQGTDPVLKLLHGTVERGPHQEIVYRGFMLVKQKDPLESIVKGYLACTVVVDNRGTVFTYPPRHTKTCMKLTHTRGCHNLIVTFPPDLRHLKHHFLQMLPNRWGIITFTEIFWHKLGAQSHCPLVNHTMNTHNL